MNYQIIQDMDLLREFVDWLPKLKKNETFYVSLLARNKYAPELKSDKAQLKRFTSSRELLISKIKQLECAFGAYQQDFKPIPQQSLALYINPNPRDMETAAKNGLIKLAQLITQPYNGYNPHQEMLSEIQKACSRKTFIDFDFDNVDLEQTLAAISPFINADAYHVLRTRGGFHLIVEPSRVKPEFVKVWHQAISTQSGCDVKGDNLIPVAGCAQGGFVPHFIR